MKIKRIGVILALSLALLIIVVMAASLSEKTTNAGSSLSLSPQEENHLLWSYQTGGSVRSIAISSDGSYIAAGSDDNKVYLFSRDSSTPLWSYQTGDDVRSVSISSDGSYIAAGGWDGKVYLFSRASSTPLWSYQAPVSTSVSISSDGSRIAAACSQIYLFSRSDNTPLWSYATEHLIKSVSISSDGSYIAAGRGQVYLLSGTDNTTLWSYSLGNYIDSVSISSDGSYIAAGDWDDKVYLFSRADNFLWSYQVGGEVSISSDGNYIAAGDGHPDYKLYLFSRTSSTPLWSHGDGWFYSVSISSDGSYIAGGAGTLHLFSRSDNIPLWSYYMDGGAVSSVSISLDGSYIAAGTSKVCLFRKELPAANNPPSLSSGSVSPSSGTPETTFTYEVTYTDADGDAPTYVKVYIDGSSYGMSYVSGTYTGGALYRYTTSLSPSLSYTYHFEASDGTETARLPSSGSYSGPTVSEELYTSPTTLTISPSSFTLQVSNSTTLSATLKDENDNPLAGKTISWSKTAGSLSATSGTTDSAGQVSVTYTAPDYETTVTVTASFVGDSQYQTSSGNSSGVITVAPAVSPTTLAVSPSNLAILSRETRTLTATLTSGGSPLQNKTISWSATAGSLSATSGTTNSSGQVTVTYTAPSVSTSTAVTVTASFAGDSQYESSSDSSSGAVTPFEVTLTFRKPDGTPLANTEIYYGYSGDQVTNLLGTTDNDGRLTTQENIGGQTIYFTSSDGKYAGSASISSTGGEVTAELTEVSEFPILWVATAVVIVAVAIGAVVFIKKRK